VTFHILIHFINIFYDEDLPGLLAAQRSGKLVCLREVAGVSVVCAYQVNINFVDRMNL
jgi:hypothetical protein